MTDEITRFFVYISLLLSAAGARVRQTVAATPSALGRASRSFLVALDTRGAALISVLSGGVLLALGAALVFTPAGVGLAGILLIAFGLLIVDFPRPNQ